MIHEILLSIIGAAFVYASCYQETMRHAKRTGSRKASSKPPAKVLPMPTRKEVRNHG